MADMLSQNNLIGCGTFTLKFASKEINQRIYAVTAAMDLYSASAELLKTMDYLLDFQLIRDCSRKMQNLVNDILISTQLAQSLLE